jgi:hypothetical protein
MLFSRPLGEAWMSLWLKVLAVGFPQMSGEGGKEEKKEREGQTDRERAREREASHWKSHSIIYAT